MAIGHHGEVVPISLDAPPEKTRCIECNSRPLFNFCSELKVGISSPGKFDEVPKNPIEPACGISFLSRLYHRWIPLSDITEYCHDLQQSFTSHVIYGRLDCTNLTKQRQRILDKIVDLQREAEALQSQGSMDQEALHTWNTRESAQDEYQLALVQTDRPYALGVTIVLISCWFGGLFLQRKQNEE